MNLQIWIGDDYMTEKAFKYAKTPETKQKNSNFGNQKNGVEHSVSPAERILHLQSIAGNQAVQTLIKSGALQAKLKVSHPNDMYEQEADRMAKQVMRISEPKVQLKCTGCNKDEKDILQTKKVSKHIPVTQDQDVPPVIHEVLRSPGQPLDPVIRTFMEPRFEYDFSKVRVRSEEQAAASAEAINAHAYTVGQEIVFADGKYAPGTDEGKELIAHELTHVVQQAQNVQRNIIQMRAGCSSSKDTTITEDHRRARKMLSNAIAAVALYDGTKPAKVRAALSAHFHGATSNAFATWINLNLRILWALTWMAGYECYTGGILERTWACGSNALATTFWCVPGIDIRLCPSYFSQSAIERSTTLIHEWIHKYGCNFDLGYEHEDEYSKNRTVTQLLNADSFANFIRDVQ
jgi:hypothetical protein